MLPDPDTPSMLLGVMGEIGACPDPLLPIPSSPSLPLLPGLLSLPFPVLQSVSWLGPAPIGVRNLLSFELVTLSVRAGF